jgi:IclR family acetate operon transcriptional repressor
MEPSTAIDKALDVLFHLNAQPEPQRVSEIGRALGLPKSSAHRLLAALGRRELVEQDELGRYRPGVGLLGLAFGSLEREPLVAAARPVLEQQAAELGETFFLVAARGGRLIVLDKAEGTGMLRASPRVGSSVPVHASAVGKLYLAHAPERVTLERPLQRYTPHTIVSLRKLQAQVQTARASGHALSRGEWIEGLSVIAAPVFHAGSLLGTVCAAIAGAQPLQDERLVVARAMHAAAAIGARLGGESHEGVDRR